MPALTGAIMKVRGPDSRLFDLELNKIHAADLGICRNPRYKLGQPCVQEYHKRIPVSEPQADFDGRNAVYAMKYHALLSTMYRDRKFRQVLMEELKALINMAGFARSESDVTSPSSL